MKKSDKEEPVTVEYQKNNDVLNTTNRGNPAESGLCTMCRADCRGRCETWMTSLKGRKMLYPRDFGLITSGTNHTEHVGVSYSNLRIRGYHHGATGLSQGLTTESDDCIFPNVSLKTTFGNKIKTTSNVPFMTGALGSTFVAEKYWPSFAIGAALVGYPIVVGENVVGVDRKAVIENGRIVSAPELDRRIELYRRYYSGAGAILVQINVEDTRNGVAEYLIEKYGQDVVLELKWGQGAKDIGGEIQVSDMDYALFLKKRGYIVDPDPELAAVQDAFRAGAIRSFARHSRLGYTNLSSSEEVMQNFTEQIGYLRGLGFERITLKTGAYGMESLAVAMKLASELHLDLLTIDGAGGGTGMSPWNMMSQWGIPSVSLHAKAYEYAQILSSGGVSVADLAFGGGFAREDHLFKALALGAPYVKLVCMGRALMIPAFVGTNVEGALHPERRVSIFGNWDAPAPNFTQEFGGSPEEIFAGYHDLKEKVGAEEMERIPYGAIAVWTLADKLSAGLQQFLAGARKFDVGKISRDDLMSANRDTERETGIGYMTEINDERAKQILKS